MRRLTGFLLLFVLGVSTALADDGTDFFGYPLDSTPEQVQAALAKNGEVSVSNDARGPVFRVNFSSGSTEVAFAGDRIYKIHHTQGLFPEATLRKIDAYFVGKLGRPHFIKLKELQSFFAPDDWAACDNACIAQCPGASSPYACDAGKACHQACRTRLVPADATGLQDFLFKGATKADNEYAAYWPCTGRGPAEPQGGIFAGAPDKCLLRLTVEYCRTGDGGAHACQYDMLYLDEELGK